ncbi:MAG: acetyl-CoA C-acyltransferase [Saprospiraceae bacterium]|nr:acetyl-CoA C-acyltransferase [Saprospiraceae bacterium]
MNEVYIVSMARTPMGSFGGTLAGFSAIQLGIHAAQAAIEKSGIDKSLIEQVWMGNVCSANLGQAPARQVALGSGLQPSTVCTTVNKVCASGMKAIDLAAQAIQLGHADIILAGGMESMSNIPFYASSMRWGAKYGHSQFIDGLQRDGLSDAYNHKAMGNCGDATAAHYGISRDAQDAYAIRSYQLAQKATDEGKLKNEITPIPIPQKKGDPVLFAEDEEIRKVDFSKIASLKPSFGSEGTVTAANASTINDGASALVLMSGQKLKELGLKPLARIVASADAEQAPEWFTTSPTLAASQVLKRAGLSWNDISFIEVNEAFSVVPIAFQQIMKTNPEIMNIHGGAVSMGHPLGSSGSRIVISLLNILQQNNARYGLAAICNGGGGASAMVVELV